MTVTNLIVASAVAAVIALATLAFIPSGFVRSRLKFSVWLFLAVLVLEAAASRLWADQELLEGLARLSFVLGVINFAVAVIANPWRDNRASDRFPAIVQDVVTIGLFVVAATLLMKEQLLTTSAVGAVVVGFALQDTLGNLFAGLAIQIEKPFRVGQWIAIGDREGQVQEITWRATKLRTKAGQFLIVPNGIMSKEAILNYSEPTIPTRLDLDVGASYLTPPNEVKQALREALSNSSLVLQTPPAWISLHDFGSSAITYRVRFWVADYAGDQQARDQVRTNIWYTFQRHKIDIPYPIQVQYEIDPPMAKRETAEAIEAQLGEMPLFSYLTPESRALLVARGEQKLFAAGEAIVRQDAAGDSMFVVLSGRVRVVLEPEGQEVAITGPGGFFGEMSMLTGEPRTATVRAIEDVRVLEIEADDFREVALGCPGLVEHVTGIVSERRTGLEEARTAAAAAGVVTAAPLTLLARVKKFLRLP